ncbi:MAG: hypothetical protein OQK47_08025 [Gammaproteobacteria bacterium]|nr:hypothetical protein [Gammaproteobacteria bacterium]
MAVLAALLPGQGQTLGLGEIELNSALNQELDAEIEVLSAVPEDAEQLIVKLADRDAFARAGIDRPFLLQQLKFKVLVKDDKPYVKVFTKSAVKEPFLSFLVEIDWPEGHMLREYTLLLDPPVYSGIESSRPASEDGGRPFIDPAEQAVAQSANASQAVSSRPAENYQQQAQVMQPQMPAVVESYSAGGEVTYKAMPQARDVSGSYRVKENDTLWSMANRFRPDASVSVEQMMLALVRENPEAFIAENIHGVKRGYILRMPDRNSINSLDRQQALAQVKAHASLWREYRQSQTGAAPASAMETDQSAGEMQQDMAEMEQGKLSIVSASEGEGSEADIAGQDPGVQIAALRNQLSLARESLESERLEKENLRARLNELEERVGRVLEMDDSELAKLQQDLTGAKQEVEAVAEPEMPEAVQPEMPVEDTQATTEEDQPGVVELPAEASTEEMDAEKMAADILAAESAAEGSVVTDETAQAPAGEDALFVDETAGAETEAMAPVEAEPAQVMPETSVPAFVQTQQKSFIEKLLDQPSMLAAIGGAILAVIALIALLIRRKRVNASDEDEWVAPSETDELDNLDEDATVQMNALDETTKLDSDDLSDVSNEPGFDEDLEDTVMSLAGDSEAAPAEEEQDDVLAEADVYLAYGIYQQAEDLLNNAINANPDRDDYRMKLLETHFAGKNSDAFANLAEEVKQRKGDDKSYWDRVVLMGRDLCPANALFEAGDIDVSGMGADDLLPQKPESTDLDLDADAMDLGDDLDSDATQVLSEPLDLGSMESADDEMQGLDDLAEDLSGFDEDLSLDDAIEESADSAMDEDLEFNLGDLDAGETDEVETADDSLDMDDDFALDFEASDLGLEESSEVETESAENEMDLSMDMDADTDNDLALNIADDEELDLSMDMDTDTGEDASLDLAGDEELDLSMDIDTDTDTGEEASLDLAGDEELDLSMDMAADDSEEVSFDMEDAGEVELDMSMDDDAGEAEISIDAGDDEFDISSLSEEIDEVGTKLELARAYLEMGDKEGAASILDEVKQEGNDAQQKEAEELLQQAS